MSWLPVLTTPTESHTTSLLSKASTQIFPKNPLHKMEELTRTPARATSDHQETLDTITMIDDHWLKWSLQSYYHRQLQDAKSTSVSVNERKSSKASTIQAPGMTRRDSIITTPRTPEDEARLRENLWRAAYWRWKCIYGNEHRQHVRHEKREAARRKAQKVLSTMWDVIKADSEKDQDTQKGELGEMGKDCKGMKVLHEEWRGKKEQEDAELEQLMKDLKLPKQ